jgi:hypothetical protein
MSDAPTVARSDAETIAGVIGWPSAIRYVERDQLDGLERTHESSVWHRFGSIVEPAFRVVDPPGRYPHPPAVAHDGPLLAADPLPDREHANAETRGLAKVSSSLPVLRAVMAVAPGSGQPA